MGPNNRGTHLQQVLEQSTALLRQLGCRRHAEFACGGCLVDKIHSAAGQGVQPRSSTSEPAAASNKYRHKIKPPKAAGNAAEGLQQGRHRHAGGASGTPPCWTAASPPALTLPLPLIAVARCMVCHTDIE